MDSGSTKNIIYHLSASSVVKAVLIVALFYAAFVLRDIVLILLTAVLLASAAEPLVRWLVHRKIPRVPAVLLIYLGSASLMGIFFSYMIIPLINDVAAFIRGLPEFISALETWVPLEGVLGGEIWAPEVGETLTVQEIIARLNEVFSGATAGLLSFLSIIFGGIFSFILIVVISFYLAIQENGVAKFLRAITPRKHEEYVVGLWNRAETKIGLWVQGQIILAILVGVLVFVGLTVLGVPNALFLAVLAGVLELIPLFGPILAAIPAVLIALVDGGMTLALLVALLYVVIQQFESQALYPLLVKKMVGVSPIVVIVSLVVGFNLAGFLGILLSVPMAAVFMEFFKDLEKRKLSQSPPSVTSQI